MEPYYSESGIEIYHGDAREILPSLPKVDLVLTDPPYGMKWDGKVSVGRNGHGAGSRSSNYGITIVGDDKPFDPSQWLSFEKVILFGCNHFASRLPVGTTLVWVKRFDDAFGSFLSDAEVAWMKGGHGVYCFRDTSLMGETQTRLHPAQKPVALMKWCLSFAPDAQTILDPFMGSGTTLRAAKDLGRQAIGIEIEEKYCEIAANRLRQEVLKFEAVA